ncbi:hypothetical protein [Pseudotamlana agarivorans]|uniref:hypothetical protein n=1 Tax=Pseudotamlana agarivorans TaxID=481183 RepID=UPI0008309170|nr:hypothetical protein [Tamlana agarivorans]
MAIIFSKEITDLYPAYNDSYINFKSSQFDDIKYTEITTPMFSKPFRIYPDLNGDFQFNLKEIAKVHINENGFEDNHQLPIGFFEILDDRILNLELDFYMSNTFDFEDDFPNEEDLTKSFTFFKSVKQVDEVVFNNNQQILSKSKNGIDYTLTHFEGFPFFFELQKVNEDDEIKIINVQTGDDATFTASTSGTSRIWIDKGNENTTTTGLLPLTDTVNRLNIYNNGSFKTNLNLKKVPSKCGVYLKWYNDDGGYNFYLFDKFYRSSTSSKSIAEATRNEFKNLDESPNSFSYSIGKEVTKDLRVKTNVSNDELFYLKSILSSPSIQLYTSETPFVNGKWITVNVDGSIDEKKKKNINEIIINIELPIQYTMNY